MDGAYKKSNANVGLDSLQFELDLLTVVLLNAFHYHEYWKISSNNHEVSTFADIILELSDERFIFLQSKFKQTRKVTREQLFSCNPKNDEFSLPKCFFSYLQIKFYLKKYVICTNTEVNPKGLEEILERHYTERDSLLHFVGAPFFTINEDILPDLKASAEIYFDKNLQGKNVDKSLITDENMKNFLQNFQIFANYPSGDVLHKIIETLLSELSDSWNKTSYYEIYRKVEEWYKQPKGEYLTEVRAKAMLCEIRSDRFCESLKDFNVFFDSTFLDIKIGCKIIHVTAKKGYLLQILKIYNALQDDKSRKLYVNPEDTVELQTQTVEAFSHPQYIFLIMAWTTKREIIEKLRAVLERSRYKKLILVADTDVELAEHFYMVEISRIDGFVTFQDISNDSQERLLKTNNVLFQNDRITVGELLHAQTTEEYRRLLDSVMLEELIRGTEIKVGVRPVGLDADIARYYICRRFKRKIDELGNIGDILTETTLYNVEEKIIAISDSAGMGKSTVLAKLAVAIKNSNPSLWVIKINLDDYTRVFRDFVKINRNQINATELLNSLEATKLSNEFERLVFSMKNKVVLMLDGVDEVSPIYTDLVLSLLSHCQKAPNFAKIFVTTRPHVDLKLKEAELFQILPFSKQEEIDFLTHYWMYSLRLSHENEERCKLYADILINKISTWAISNPYGQNPFSEVPLQVKMIAEIFQENFKTQESAHWEGCKEYLERCGVAAKLPAKFNIAKLFDMFIKKKRGVYVEKGSSTGSATAVPVLLNHFEACLAYHRRLAVGIILPEYQQLFKTQVPEDDDTEEYILKMGIAQRLGGRVHFLHRTFAEYFVADRIVEELKAPNPDANFQQFLIDGILVKNEFKVVRTFLDIQLQDVSLPLNIFNEYRSMKSSADLYPIFQLTTNGHASILRVILESVGFKVIVGRSIRVTNWRLRIPFRTRNVLNNLAVLVRQAGVNIRNDDGESLLHCAVKGSHLEMVDFLVRQGADVNMKSSVFQAHVTSYWRIWIWIWNAVKLLVNQPQRLNSRSPYNQGLAPLHFAVRGNQIDIVEYLLEHGADVDLKGSDNDTALHLAAYKGDLNIVKCLIEHGADVNAGGDEGLTALHIATKFEKEDVVQYLLKHGADVNLKSSNYRMKVHVAVRWGA